MAIFERRSLTRAKRELYTGEKLVNAFFFRGAITLSRSSKVNPAVHPAVFKMRVKGFIFVDDKLIPRSQPEESLWFL